MADHREESDWRHYFEEADEAADEAAYNERMLEQEKEERQLEELLIHCAGETFDFAFARAQEVLSPDKFAEWCAEIRERLGQYRQLADGDFHPSQDMIDILRILRDSPVPMIQASLAVGINRTRKTVSHLLGRLTQESLVHRPNGERGGWMITEQGITYLERIPH